MAKSKVDIAKIAVIGAVGVGLFFLPKLLKSESLFPEDEGVSVGGSGGGEEDLEDSKQTSLGIPSGTDQQTMDQLYNEIYSDVQADRYGDSYFPVSLSSNDSYEADVSSPIQDIFIRTSQYNPERFGVNSSGAFIDRYQQQSLLPSEAQKRITATELYRTLNPLSEFGIQSNIQTTNNQVSQIVSSSSGHSSFSSSSSSSSSGTSSSYGGGTRSSAYSAAVARSQAASSSSSSSGKASTKSKSASVAAKLRAKFN